MQRLPQTLRRLTAFSIIGAMQSDARIRIDKWLWAARFFKTRTLAADAVDLGRVRINGERVKPAREARVGDRIEVFAGELRSEFVIRALSALRGPAPAAQQLYEETADSRARRERRREMLRYGADPARSIKGRPTKREGRMLRSARASGADGD
jgi:ribosome-associated heat shock protein Hsp15